MVTLRHSAQERLRNDAVIVQVGGTPPGKLLGAFDVEVVTKFGEA